jgi:hypothetical protein
MGVMSGGFCCVLRQYSMNYRTVAFASWVILYKVYRTVAFASWVILYKVGGKIALILA